MIQQKLTFWICHANRVHTRISTANLYMCLLQFLLRSPVLITNSIHRHYSLFKFSSFVD